MDHLKTSMNLIIIHKNKSPEDSSSNNLLRFALAHEPLASVILEGLSRSLSWNGKKGIRYCAKCRPANIIYAIPKEWGVVPDALHGQNGVQQHFSQTADNIISYTDAVRIPPDIINIIKQRCNPESWLVISNGQFSPQINNKLLGSVLSDIQADIIAMNAEPELLGKREKIRLTTEGNLAGFRRLYADTVEFTPNFNDWPHNLFVKAHVFKKILTNHVLPESFSAFIKKCRSNALILRAVKVGGNVLDLEMDEGLLEFFKMILATTIKPNFKIRNLNKISKDSRFIGKVLLGKDVKIDSNVVIVGPTVIGNNVHIENGVTINSSIIGPEVHVPQNQVINNKILKETRYDKESPSNGSTQTVCSEHYISPQTGTDMTYRYWPRFSYARFFKRIADCFVAVIVLILFAPLIPFIALAIKLNSHGPVFFIDKRQGFHGREFNCLKFRTMVAGADKIQEKLRFVSQVDGPQFKMNNDPRISAVGRFMRDTYIDEIPQFFNVLLGQMSVVGPRPSPESENTLCPFWRDARLSVRPGITGLWQVLRTRVPTKDFQEWIRYDTEYVRNLSPKMDLWICGQTFKKLFEDFINQF